MHPSRTSHSPTTGVHNPPQQQPQQRRLTPPNDPLPSTAPHHSQTSLPSIRQLHPYLPAPGMSQHLSATSEAPGSGGGSGGYNYPGPPHYASQFAQQDQPPHPQGPSRDLDTFGGVDSDGDDVEQQHGPPKKKRRRQALSCTGDCLLFLVHYL
jgi:hypothetical protein